LLPAGRFAHIEALGFAKAGRIRPHDRPERLGGIVGIEFRQHPLGSGFQGFAKAQGKRRLREWRGEQHDAEVRIHSNPAPGRSDSLTDALANLASRRG